jgi:hypothetical protein
LHCRTRAKAAPGSTEEGSGIADPPVNVPGDGSIRVPVARDKIFPKK